MVPAFRHVLISLSLETSRRQIVASVTVRISGMCSVHRAGPRKTVPRRNRFWRTASGNAPGTPIGDDEFTEFACRPFPEFCHSPRRPGIGLNCLRLVADLLGDVDAGAFGKRLASGIVAGEFCSRDTRSQVNSSMPHRNWAKRSSKRPIAAVRLVCFHQCERVDRRLAARCDAAAFCPYACNARTHCEAQIAEIAGSIRAFGLTNPILVGEDRDLVAGHGLVAARKLWLAELPIIVVAGLSDRERALAGVCRQPEPSTPAGTEGLIDEDAVREVVERLVSRTSDLWRLGRHRLICGVLPIGTPSIGHASSLSDIT